MSIQVKICGTTSLADARLAAEAGADLLGFIFYPPSPRHVAPEEAARIVATLRAERGAAAPQMVGVCVDEPVERVRTLIDEIGLDLVQLHGSEPPAELRLLAPYAFKALRPQTRGDAEALVATYSDVVPANPAAPDFLVDSYHPWKMGGTGEPINLAIGQVLARRFRLLLAGGLTPENVAEAIARVQPWGVDVASGVEAEPGRKDPEKVRAFVRAAKESN